MDTSLWGKVMKDRSILQIPDRRYSPRAKFKIWLIRCNSGADSIVWMGEGIRRSGGEYRHPLVSNSYEFQLAKALSFASYFFAKGETDGATYVLHATSP